MTKQTNPASLIAIATDLQANNTKLEIVGMARAFGWKGDHARAPMLQLALFVATKLAAQDDTAQSGGSHDAPPAEGEGAQSDKPQSEKDREAEADKAEADKAEADKAEADEAEADEAEAEAAQEAPQEAPQRNPPATPAEPQETPQEAPQAETEGNPPATPAEPQGDAQNGDDDAQGDDDMEEPETPEPNEFAKLLKASGIHNPHRLLEKVWLLTAKAKLNLMLVGPAGSGKTMIAEQLAQLLKLPFGSVSCTMGMSESQLTGWLMPREGGNFKYTPAPFINCMQAASVFLLDEIDAADANVMMILNSALANGFISVPQRIDEPMVKRTKESIVIAGANSLNGGTSTYSARADLDGATKDRFYTLAVDYDMNYIKGLFDADKKTARKSPRWKPVAPPDQFGMSAAGEFVVQVMGKVSANKMQKIIGTRFAQKLAAALKVGIPFEEIKADLFMGYSADEMNRLGVK